ncbi:MAG: arylsulfatase [Verrucomicrobiales bacterium]
MRIPFTPAIATCLLLLICSDNAAVKESRPPNLVYIMADDLGYGDLGCFGQKTIKTPHLDKLAKAGMRFTNYYAGNTVCRPSRLALWTGKHMGHTPISSNAQYHFKPEDITVAELLKEKGYATGGVGKWAMGGTGTSGHPNENGFDFWFGYLNQGEAHNYYPTHLWRNTEKIPLKGNVLTGNLKDRGRVAKIRSTYSHDLITAEALNFVRKNKSRPFLLHIHWTIPHANNEGGRATGDGMEIPDYGIYASRDWPSAKKGAAAMITRMDADVGKFIALLNELKLEKNTLVFFTSDNGPHSEGGHKHETFNANGPLRGYKRDLYEGGIRVPAIAFWPGRIDAGSSCAEPLAFWDWLPTACELAGIRKPEDTDGLSFAPTLLGHTSEQVSHPYLFWKYGKKQALRRAHWKFVLNAPQTPPELYDLRTDIGETNNLAGDNPDIVDELHQLIKEASL